MDGGINVWLDETNMRAGVRQLGAKDTVHARCPNAETPLIAACSCTLLDMFVVVQLENDGGRNDGGNMLIWNMKM